MGAIAAALDGAAWRRRLAIGAVAGLAHFLVALAWVPEFSLPGFVLLVLLETSFWALAAILATGRWPALGLAGALVLAEAGRANFPFEGLPLAGIDLGQAGGPLLWAARLGGPFAVTLATGLLGAAAFASFRRQWAPAVIAAALAVLTVGGGWSAPLGANVGSLEAAVVQGGGPRGFRGVDTDFTEVFDRHVEAAQALEPGVELVLWPENAVTVPAGYRGSPEEAVVDALASRLGATVVVGVVEDGGPGRFRNLAAVSEAGTGSGSRVEKAIRVPFGEYVPLRSLVGRFADLSAIPSEAVPGTKPGIVRTEAGPLAVSISYEVFFPRRSRDAVRRGAEILLVPTNAASFRTSQVPGQELAAARLRAVETGRWVLQAAPTGYSAIVDPDGSVRRRSDLGESEVLADTVARRTGHTPFVSFGPWPWLLLALALPAASVAAGRRRVAEEVGPSGGRAELPMGNRAEPPD